MVRVKNRYIVVQIVLEKPSKKPSGFNDGILAQYVLKNVKKYYGDFGLGSVERGLRIKYCNDETKVAIIRSSHRVHRFVTSILPLIMVIGDHKAKFNILYIGATIMQCNKFIVRHQRDYLNRAVGEIESAKERADLIRNVMDLELDE